MTGHQNVLYRATLIRGLTSEDVLLRGAAADFMSGTDEPESHMESHSSQWTHARNVMIVEPVKEHSKQSKPFNQKLNSVIQK